FCSPTLRPLADLVDAFSFRTTEDDLDDFSPKLASMLEGQCMDWDSLPAENDMGCVEYKWSLGQERDASSRRSAGYRLKLVDGNRRVARLA
ncbi:unnamed protein product, partial [Polarella glacialis]